jgi:hypothetical protein
VAGCCSWRKDHRHLGSTRTEWLHWLHCPYLRRRTRTHTVSEHSITCALTVLASTSQPASPPTPSHPANLLFLTPENGAKPATPTSPAGTPPPPKRNLRLSPKPAATSTNSTNPTTARRTSKRPRQPAKAPTSSRTARIPPQGARAGNGSPSWRI